MERNHTKLEADAIDGKRDPGQQQRESGPAHGKFPHTQELHGAGIGINEGHAEEKKCGGSRSQNQVLDSGFERQLTVSQVSHHGVQRDAQDLEPEKERNEVTARHQDYATQSREEKQEIQLFAMPAMIFQVRVG